MSKKVAFFIGCWLILSAILFVPMFAWIGNSGSPVYETQTINETQPRVYVTNSGDFYHNGSCQYLHSSKIEKGRTQAYDEGYTACSVCKGTPSGTIQVSYEKRVEKDSTARDVWCSIGISAILGLLVLLPFAEWLEGKFFPQKEPATESVAKVEPTHDPQPEPLSEKEKRRAWFNSMNEHALYLQLNRPIIHKTFGRGYITRFREENGRKYMQVWFDDLHDFKEFVFPDCFIDEYLDYYYP